MSHTDYSTLVASVEVICRIEAETFEGEERGEVIAFLKKFILDNRGTDDHDMLVAIGSAIRKYVAMSNSHDLDELEWLAVLLDGKADISIELEVAKMIGRKLKSNPLPDFYASINALLGSVNLSPCTYPELSWRLVGMVEAYLHPQVLPRAKFATTAMLAAEAVARMGTWDKRVAEAVEHAPLWFREQLTRRLDSKVNPPGARHD